MCAGVGWRLVPWHVCVGGGALACVRDGVEALCTVARNAVTEWAGSWAGCQLRLCLLQLLLFALGLVLDIAKVCCQPLIVLL